MSSEEENEGCNRLRKLYKYNHLMEAGKVGNHWGGCVCGTMYV
jgi:hypothetical protein